MRSSKTGRKTSNVASAVRHVATPNVANILLFNFCGQNCIQNGPIPIANDSFSKKNGLIMSVDQNPHQTVTHFGCLGFSMRQFCMFTYPPRSKWASSEKMIFFYQTRHLCKSKKIVWSRSNLSEKKCGNFACLPTRQDQNELHLKKWFFLLPKSVSL